MSQASQLPSELAQGLLQLARALLAAARNRTLHPPEHPTVSASVPRLTAWIIDESEPLGKDHDVVREMVAAR